MAENTQPPLLPENNEDSDNDDMFTSAMEQKKEEPVLNTLEAIEDVNLDSDEDAGPANEPKPSIQEEDSKNENEDIFEDIPESRSNSVLLEAGNQSINAPGSPRPQNLVMHTAPPQSLEEPKPAVLKTPEEFAGQYLRVLVKDPHKIGDGMSAYLVYTVTTQTNIKLFKKTEFTVTRRFSDFLGLHDKLIEKYLHKGRLVPAAPEKSVVGTTKIKMGSQSESEGKVQEFVERRRAALERFLNRTAAHPVFQVDPDFRDFLECETELPRATNTSALSGAGVLRLFNKMGETVNKMAFKMGESDPWFEDRHQQLETLEAQVRRLQASLEGLSSHRRELAMSTASLGRSLALLSSGEDHTVLSRSLAKMADLQEKLEVLNHDQANNDFFILHELMKDYVALMGVIKDVFHERVKAFQTWQHAQQMLSKKREAVDRYEAAGRVDRVAPAKDEVLEWEAKVNRSQDEFENISKTIKSELERFEVQRVKDFKVAFISYFQEQLKIQEKVIECWESYVPEAKAIAA